MNAFGILILVQPAVFCLVLGCAMTITGVAWILGLRHFPNLSHKKAWALITLVIAFLAFSLMTKLRYDLPPVHFEWISGLG